MPSLRATALAAVITLAALPAAAQAGSVGYDLAGTTLTFTAAGGEANDLQVTRTATRVVFQELGGLAITSAEPACTGSGSPELSCAIAAIPPGAVTGVAVGLGDLGDRLTAGPLGTLSVEADGMDGADRLDASDQTGYALLLGGSGGDQLLAGLAESDLDGGAGDDVLTGAPAGALTSYFMGSAPDGADAIHGGAGVDVAEYVARANPLRLSADGVADDGEPGEGDAIDQAVEGLRGGAGADVIVASGLVDAELSGHAGSDQLTGGAGDDALFGGEGDDTMSGNGGDDVALPADRADELLGGGPTDAGADAFAGGPGFDTMDYSNRLAPVKATLDGEPNDGESGEADNVGVDVEELIGGRGTDTLTGTGAAQRIVGGGGADTIDPGTGIDAVRAGDGNDTIRAQDGSAEPIACGLGTDTLTGDHDDVPDACENITLGAPPLPPDTRKPKVKIGGLPQRPRWHHVRNGLRPRIGADEPAAFVVELLGAATTAHISARRPYNLVLVRRTIKHTAKARRISLRPRAALLGPRRKLRVRIRVTATDAAGNVRVARRTLKVRR
jgi:Ca2+-binding RTX toxin-like protein